MFRKIWILLTFVLFVSLSHSDYASASTVRPIDAPVIANGKRLPTDTNPIMVNNRVLVPFRVIAQTMGASVHWNAATQQVFVQKSDKAIMLRMQSSTATVNGQTMTLDAPPVIYRGRTFVPIRFIAEALDARVTWTGKEVRLSFAVFHPWSYTVYANGAPLSTPVMTDGQYRYVPFKALVTALDANAEWSEDAEKLVVHATRARIVLYENSKEVEVDANIVTLPIEPVRNGNEWYVSLSSISTLFKGQFTITPAKEVYISVPRTTFRSAMLPKQSVSIVRPQLVREATVVDQRRLLVSDNPEMLAPSTVPDKYGTLSIDTVETTNAEVDHRVFGWHINLFSEKVNVAIVIENLSVASEIEIVNRKGTYRISPNSWGHYDVGLPIAETVLRNGLAVSPATIVRPQSERILHLFDVPPQQLLGFLYDFTVVNRNGGESLHYRIRTVVTPNFLSPLAVDPTPVALDSYATHARGVWDGATLETTLPTYTVGSAPIAYNVSNGQTDHYMSVQRALSPAHMTIHNPGHYGATYRVHIPITRDALSAQTIRLRFSARGGVYCGAVRINGVTYIIPPLEPFTQSAYIDCFIWGQHDVLTLELMHAGGAALPLGIEISTP